jgi:hypothetical protein
MAVQTVELFIADTRKSSKAQVLGAMAVQTVELFIHGLLTYGVCLTPASPGLVSIGY